MTKKIVVTLNNVQEVDLTTEEETQKQADTVNDEAKMQTLETAKQAKATAQVSGNQKLLDLGLTQAEATALTGYTPPEEE